MKDRGNFIVRTEPPNRAKEKKTSFAEICVFVNGNSFMSLLASKMNARLQAASIIMQ